MKFKRIIALLTGVVVLGTSAISASAVEYDKTETYYVYQQETFGEVAMYPSNAAGNTYCELASSLKMTYVTFCYQNTSNQPKCSHGGIMQYENNGDCNLGYITGDTYRLDYARGARTQSGVQVTQYITWTSAGCDDNAQVGTIIET